MPNPLERALFLFMLATLVWFTAMGVEANGIAAADHVPAGCYFSAKPILDVELAERPECFVAETTEGVAPGKLTHNLRLFRVNTEMDFLFIILYLLVFVLFAFSLGGRWTEWSNCHRTHFCFGRARCGGEPRNPQGTRAHCEFFFHGRPPAAGFFFLKMGAPRGHAGVLGVLVWLRRGRLFRLTAIALFVSGVLTLLGLGIPHVMVYAAYGFAISFLLILARVFPYPADSVLLWIEYAYLLRFQIFLEVLALALPLAYRVLPSLFVGVFDARGFTSFVFVVWAAFQMGWTILVTSRLVFVYGPDRFIRATSIMPKRVGAGLVAAFGLLALPVVVILFLGTSALTFPGKVLATILGLLLAIGVLALTASLHFAIEDPGNSADLIFPSFGFLTRTVRPTSVFWTFIGTYLGRHPPDDLQAGILDTTPGNPPRLRSGHEMAAIALAVFSGVYVILGIFFFSPARRNPDREPAALFFVLLLLAVLTWLFSGAAFFLPHPPAGV